MNDSKSKIVFMILIIISIAGCMAKDVEFTEQQQRMQRCDQYVDKEREACLQGSPVTLEDYKDDYRAYQRAKEKEEKQLEIELLDKNKQKLKDNNKEEGKPLS